MSLAYKTGGMDIGFSWFPVSNNGIIPTIAIEPRCLALLSLKKDIQTRFIVYPLITSTAAWQCKNGLLYSGLDFILPLSDSDYDDDASSTIISPFIGYGWKLGNNYALFTELKWMGANIRSDQLAVEYLPIARYGAITPLISLERSF